MSVCDDLGVLVVFGGHVERCVAVLGLRIDVGTEVDELLNALRGGVA